MNRIPAVLIGAAICVTGCAGESQNADNTPVKQLQVSTASCMNAPESEQISSMSRTSIAVVEAIAKVTTDSQALFDQQGYSTIATKVDLTEVKVLRVKFEGSFVWVLGGETKDVRSIISDPAFYSGVDGRAILTLVTDTLATDVPMIVSSNPVVDSKAIVGLGCFDGRGFGTTTAFKGELVVFGRNGGAETAEIEALGTPVDALISTIKG